MLKTKSENKSKTIYFYLSDDELKELDSNAKAYRLSRSEYVRLKISVATMIPTLNIDYRKYANCTLDLLKKITTIDELVAHSKMVNIPLLRQTLNEIDAFAVDLRGVILTERR